MTLPQKMRAIEISRPGGPEVLVPTERPLPRPGPGRGTGTSTGVRTSGPPGREISIARIVWGRVMGGLLGPGLPFRFGLVCLTRFENPSRPRCVDGMPAARPLHPS